MIVTKIKTIQTTNIMEVDEEALKRYMESKGGEIDNDKLIFRNADDVQVNIQYFAAEGENG